MKHHSMTVLLILGFAVTMLGLAHVADSAATATWQDAEPVDFHLPLGYLAERIFTPPLSFPHHVAVSPSGIIVVADATRRGITQVHEDGTLSMYVQPSDTHYGALAFNSDSELYAVQGNTLWKITPEKSFHRLAEGVYNGALDVGPSGDIFAVEWLRAGTDVQRITPNGEVSVYASGFSGTTDVAVNPVTGEVYVSELGGSAIYRANEDGTITLLTDGLAAHNKYIEFSSDGTLHHMTDGQLYTISTLDGSVVELTWLNDKCLAVANPQAIDIDSQGRIVASDVPFNHVLRFDLEAEQMDVLHLGIGASGALGVAPNGDQVYLGVGHPSIEGDGRIVRIDGQGSTTLFVDGLLPYVSSMVFDADGIAYISAMNPGSQPGGHASTIYTATSDGYTSTLTTLGYVAHKLAIDPTTGYLWGTGHEELWYLDDEDVLHTIPFSLLSGGGPDLAFTPDGTLYVYVHRFLGGEPSNDVRGVYHVDPTGPTFNLLVDLMDIDHTGGVGCLAGGRDGNIYWLGYGNRYTPNNELETYMLQITPAGEVTLFGRGQGGDSLSLTSSLDTNDFFFSGEFGVYRVFEANVIFLPLVLKSNN